MWKGGQITICTIYFSFGVDVNGCFYFESKWYAGMENGKVLNFKMFDSIMRKVAVDSNFMAPCYNS